MPNNSGIILTSPPIERLCRNNLVGLQICAVFQEVVDEEGMHEAVGKDLMMNDNRAALKRDLAAVLHKHTTTAAERLLAEAVCQNALPVVDRPDATVPEHEVCHIGQGRGAEGG